MEKVPEGVTDESGSNGKNSEWDLCEVDEHLKPKTN
jgi:hypothetical protein